jgi:3'(2'), 5'-bisphosphate nucleotidase
MFYQGKNFKNQLIEICEHSNKIALDIYNKYLQDGTDITYKQDNSPLTIADLTVNKYVCKQLESLSKQYKQNIIIISEENKNLSFQERKAYDWVWLVDPIDGTKEFIKKNGQFTVNIGLCYKGSPVLGVVGIPVEHLIYYGCQGFGSFKLDTNTGNLKEISVSKFNLSDENLRLVCSSSHMNDATEKYVKQFKNPILKSAGSSIKLLRVAEGGADIYPRIAPTSEWDTCASHAVLLFAGGKIFQYENEKEVIYNKKNLLNPYFVCMGKFK